MYLVHSQSQHHDLAHDLAFVQTIETFVDFLERKMPAQESVDGQAALPVERDVSWDIADRYAGADVASF